MLPADKTDVRFISMSFFGSGDIPVYREGHILVKEEQEQEITKITKTKN